MPKSAVLRSNVPPGLFTTGTPREESAEGGHSVQPNGSEGEGYEEGVGRTPRAPQLRLIASPIREITPQNSPNVDEQSHASVDEGHSSDTADTVPNRPFNLDEYELARVPHSPAQRQVGANICCVHVLIS